MGEAHTASLNGLKLEGVHKEHACILAWFFGFWWVAYVGYTQKDETLKSAIFKVAVLQWLACMACGLGWIWTLKWACAARDQS